MAELHTWLELEAIVQRESSGNEREKGPVFVIVFQVYGTAFSEDSNFRRILRWDQKNKKEK